jgi:Kdo2-lipid IVA lauroyltransferase/acyltransferase
VSTWVLGALARIAGLLSWRRAQDLGAFLGLVWFHVVRIRRRTVLANLALALPEPAAEHLRIARETYRHLGICALELLKLRGLPPGEVARRVHDHGIERYEAALARGRGVIVVTAHFGNFDLLACAQACRGVPLAIVSRDLHGGANRFWMETRRAKGLAIFRDEGSLKEIVRWLKDGKVLGFVVDQRTPPGRGGILSPFFGRDVWTTTAPAVLATRTGCALLPVRIERRPDGDHDVWIEGEIAVPERGPRAVPDLTARINAVVEGWVRARPDHWMWLHRRFADAAGKAAP